MKNSVKELPYSMDIPKNNKQLFLYKKKDDTAFRKVEKWLKDHKLSYQLITPGTINKSIIFKMLCCSENGFAEILVSKFKAERLWSNYLGVEMDTITVSEMVNEIVENPRLLKNPILFDEENLLAGFHSEEIRKFVPKAYRVIGKQLKEVK